ncbi:MAG: LysR family transcriptional regulator [Leptolyngbya sp. SIO1D8]|nr:LysR family transcriptional regulator [Leptolyngbya sp. SIO1D8]
MAERERLDSLLIFVQAAKHRSFSEAARQLGMSPSAVSRAVQRLEERLGTRLLHRTTRRLSLSEDGDRFLQSAEQILSDLEEAELSLQRSQSTPSGTLRISLVPSMGRMHIVPALPAFAAQYPELKLDISLSDRRVDLIDDNLDAVVRVGLHPDSSLIMQSLGIACTVVCASPAYLEQHGTPQTPEDLRQHHCINHVIPQTGRVRTWQFQKDGEPCELEVAGTFTIDHAETATAAAIAGAGIIQFYNFVVGEAIAKGQLVPLLQDYTPLGVPIAVVYAQKRYLSAKVKAFVAFMQELAEQLKHKGIIQA